MELNIESIIFFALLLDSLGANIMAFSGGQKWWQKHFNVFAKHLPLSRGWTLMYLGLTLIMGTMLYHNDLLYWPFK